MYNLLLQIGQISGQFVVSANNPIHKIAYQVIVFQVGAFIMIYLDFYFQGQTYIIVYVGAIAILFLFVIMMVHIPIRTFSFNIPTSILGGQQQQQQIQQQFQQETPKEIMEMPISTEWYIEYKTITDISSQATLIYIAYPIALIQIGLIQWVVQIGIITIVKG